MLPFFNLLPAYKLYISRKSCVISSKMAFLMIKIPAQPYSSYP
jgi:hypothetical protein